MELETDVGVKVGMVTVVVGVNGVSAVGNRVGGMRVTVGCISIVCVGLVPNPEQPDNIKITIKRINTIFFQYIWLLPYEVPHNYLNKTLKNLASNLLQKFRKL